MSRRIWFFATRSDLLSTLESVEQRVPLNYFPCGVVAQDVTGFGSASEIVGLGQAREGSYLDQDRYLVVPKSEPFQLRRVEHTDGGESFRSDPVLNPNSVVCQTGGVFEDKFVLIGEFGTVSVKQAGFDLLETIRRKVRSDYTRVADAYIGPDAEKLARGVARLAGSTRAPTVTDLVLPKVDAVKRRDR